MRDPGNLDETVSGVVRGEARVETLWDREGETPYQTRVKCGSFRIHIFWRGDRDPDMHDHPADFWTFPLVSYVEEVKCLDDPSRAYTQVVRAFRPHYRRAAYAHRVLGAWSGEVSIGRHPSQRFGIEDRPIITLGWWGKKRREWGFHTAYGWVPWRAYVNAPGWVGQHNYAIAETAQAADTSARNVPAREGQKQEPRSSRTNSGGTASPKSETGAGH